MEIILPDVSEIIPLTHEGRMIEGMFPVMDRRGNRQRFELNWAQWKLDNGWSARNLIPKARRLGVSTYVLARWTAACMWYENINCVVVSHEKSATERLLGIVHFFINNMYGPKPETKNLSQHHIVFKDTNSKFFIGTAGADNFGRGDAIHRLHCSEYAFWKDGGRLLKGMIDAVPLDGGEVAIESTGNGHNDYSERCELAYSGDSEVDDITAAIFGDLQYRCHFLNWLQEPAHNIVLNEQQEALLMNNLREDIEEPALAGYLTPGQMAFRRHKIINEYKGDLIHFKQEFPLSLSECFQSSGHSMFWQVKFVPTNKWMQVDRHTERLGEQSESGKHYIVGADPSGGVGLDNAVIEVFCVEDQEQVYEYANNRMPPDQFAKKVREVGEEFNWAYIVVENNNHGILTLNELLRSDGEDEGYPSYLVHHAKNTNSKDEVPSILQAGFRTTAQSKPLAIGRLRKAVSDWLTIHSDTLKKEMDHFVEDENGKMGGEEGYNDDRVTASAMAVVEWNDALMVLSEPMPVKPAQKPSPFMLDGILAELATSQSSLPIAAQDMAVIN